MEDGKESPPGSPLSDLSSDAFEGEEEERLAALMPPAKRQKLGDSSRATPILHAEDDAMSTISSDTDGDIPALPPGVPPRPEDDETHEQVRICAWEGCTAGDMGNMDKLVDHIHAEHIEMRQKKYTCEWTDCARKSYAHASGYALKAHMRSHTRQKPFYCVVPECDKAFTRTDALAKHLRTVHETEALRPSDPIPKGDPVKATRLKVKIKMSREEKEKEVVQQANGTATNGIEPTGWTYKFPAELDFSPEEEARGPKELYRLLRRQIHWAEEEAESLKKQCEFMEDIRKKEWLEKEVLFDQVTKNEDEWQKGQLDALALVEKMISIAEESPIKTEAMDTATGDDVPESGLKTEPINESIGGEALASEA